MNYIRTIWYYIIIILFLTNSSFGGNDNFLSLQKEEIEKLDQQIEEISKKIKEVNSQLSKLAKEIESLKKSERGLFEEYRLQELLKKSNDISQEVNKLNKELQINKAKQQLKLKKIVQEYDLLLQNTTEKLAQYDKKDPIVDDLKKEIYTYRKERKNYIKKIEEKDDICDLNISIDPLDEPKDIIEKIDLLKDSEEKLNKKIIKIDQYIKELNETKYLIKKSANFIDKTTFFYEGKNLGRYRSFNIKEEVTSEQSKESEQVNSSEPNSEIPPLVMTPTISKPSLRLEPEQHNESIESMPIDSLSKSIDNATEVISNERVSKTRIDKAIMELENYKKILEEKILQVQKQIEEFKLKADEMLVGEKK